MSTFDLQPWLQRERLVAEYQVDPQIGTIMDARQVELIDSPIQITTPAEM